MNAQSSNSTTWFTWPTRFAWWVILLTSFAIVAATMGAKNLYFRGDYEIFFDGQNEQLLAFDEIQTTFAKSDNISIVIAPQDQTIFTKTNLTLIQQLTIDAWQIPYSSRVDSLSNYQHTEALQDDLIVEDLLYEDYPLTAERIQRAEKIALNEPALVHSMISQNGDVSVINVTIQMPEIDKTAESIEVMAYVDALIAKYQQLYPDVQFYKAGVVALNNAFMVAAQQDSTTLVPTMFGVILLFLVLMLRSISSVVATLIIIIASVTTTLGLTGWAGMFLSTATVNIPTLVMTLAVADCVHVIATMRQRMQKGDSKVDAITHSVEINALPIFITSITTAIGFMMMNMSDSPVLRDFGNEAALGVMIACLLSVTLLPALLKVLPIGIKPLANAEQTESGFMASLANLVVKHQTKLLPISVAVIALAAAAVPLNKVNDDSVRYFDTSSEFRQAADFMEQRISGMTNISIAIKTGESQGIAAPGFIATLGDFTDWLRAQPETDHVASLADTYKRLNKNMHGDDRVYYQLPQDRELAAQYLLLYEMSLPFGLDLNNQINVDKSSLKLVLTTKNLGSVGLVDLENRIYQWFTQHAPQYQVVASSPNLMFAHIGETNMTSMLSTLPITLFLISGLMIFALRSVRLGVISLMPNIAPAIIGFGLWALISGEINLGLSVVVTLTLGIVVDDAVHFLSKYQRARKQGQSAEASVRYAFHTVGRALWITTVVLVAGFSVLAMSSFRLNADMGMLSAIVIFIALVVDFIFLPALLMKFDKADYVVAASPSKQASVVTESNAQPLSSTR
ncbi:efflux RND transporter permease subunit [Vibrio scophthalmi]|uniref:Putative exporter of the RND superfamily protein n=1 Tax=Vibrio scophthalmi LMG 19158 TaxID=870967 RepID=F9RLS4_9VIBR|nr:MMPL family transporter [Vibrio scophthalmi]EGU38785.1 putative exporter of the RND superfamily protein [Vibrio scophthalmi LMG 19158]